MNTLLIIVGILIALGVAVFVGVHVYAYGLILSGGIQLKRKLKKRGRTLSVHEAKKLIDDGEGCIFAEAPTIGWNVNRVWWSPEKKINEPDERKRDEELCTEEDQANYDRFIKLKSGSAKLISVFVFMQRCPKYLFRHFGFDTCPVIWSGAVHFEGETSKREAEPEACHNADKPAS